jgi:hypothetical protein
MSILRLPHCEQRNRACQSGTVISAPYRLAISGRIGLDLVAAIPAPHDEPQMRPGGAAERHWRAGDGFQVASPVSAQSYKNVWGDVRLGSGVEPRA